MNAPFRSFRRLALGLLALLVAPMAFSQVIVYKMRINPRSSINLDFYNGGYFVGSPAGGEGSFVFTQKSKGTKVYAKSGTGTLFTGVTDSGELKWVLQANTSTTSSTAKASYLAFGSAWRPTRFSGAGYDLLVDIAKTMRGGAVASTTDADTDNPEIVGFASDFDWSLTWDEGETKKANKAGLTIAETLTSLVDKLAGDGYADESATPVTISTTSLATGVVGTTYSQTLAATGGTSPYTWSVSGTLPAGLTLSTSGTISGTPTTAGTSTFTVTAKDSATPTGSGSKAFSITISAIAVTTTSLPSVTVNTAYPSTTLAATGGTTPYTWTVSTGSLPTGLSLSSAGVITGTPTATGTTTFTVKVTDSASTPISATKSLSITVNGELSISTASLPTGLVGTGYNQTLAATGGTTPYAWSLDSGSLPDGLSLSSGGVISGTPTGSPTPGTYNFVVKATDSAGTPNTATKSLSITISDLAITTLSPLPSVTVGTGYTETLAATGGTGPYTWTLTVGSLPAGLSLVGNQITGTPTASGLSTFTLKVTDSSSPTVSVSKSFTLTVNP